MSPAGRWPPSWRKRLVEPLGGVSVAPEGGPVIVTHRVGIAAVDLAAPSVTRLARPAYGPCAAAFTGTVVFARSTGGVDRPIDRVPEFPTADGSVETTIDASAGISDLAVAPPDSRWLYAARPGPR